MMEILKTACLFLIFILIILLMGILQRICIGNDKYGKNVFMGDDNKDDNKDGEKNEKIVYRYKFRTDRHETFNNEVREILKNSVWNKKFKFIETTSNNKADYDIIIDIVPRIYMEQTGTFKSEYDENGEKIFFSRTWIQTPRIVEIDEVNWDEGVPRSGLSKEEYKIYVINHEIGHAIGYDHLPCDKENRCPVMYQMTRGVPQGREPETQPNHQDLEAERTLL